MHLRLTFHAKLTVGRWWMGHHARGLLQFPSGSGARYHCKRMHSVSGASPGVTGVSNGDKNIESQEDDREFVVRGG